MALYRFHLDARFTDTVTIELDDDSEAILMAEREGGELALRALEEGSLLEADVDALERYDEKRQRWEDVEEY